MKKFLLLAVLLAVLLTIIPSALATIGNGSQCGIVNESFTLVQDIQANGTCYIVNASNIIIDGRGFQLLSNETGWAINATASHTNITIKNFAGIRNFSFGIYGIGMANSSIVNNTIESDIDGADTSTRYHIALVTSDTVRIENNSFLVGYRGIGLYLGTSHHAHIKNNTVNDLSSRAWFVTAYSSENTTIINNILNMSSHTSKGIYLQSASDSLVKNNSITTRNVNGYGIHTYLGETNTISTNTILTSGSTGRGIYLQTTTNNTVVNNTITTSGTFANNILVHINSHNNTIQGNILTGEGSDGRGVWLHTNSDSNIVIQNTITTSGPNADGISLIAGSDYNTITNNTILTTNDTAAPALEISDSDANIIGWNLLNATKYDELVVTDNANDNIFENLQILNHNISGYFFNVSISTNVSPLATPTYLQNLTWIIVENTSAANGYVNLSLNVTEFLQNTIFAYENNGSVWNRTANAFNTTSGDFVFSNITERKSFGIFGKKLCQEHNESFSLYHNITVTSDPGEICIKLMGHNIRIDGRGYSVHNNGSRQFLEGGQVAPMFGDNLTLKNFGLIHNWTLGYRARHMDNVTIKNNTWVVLSNAIDTNSCNGDSDSFALIEDNTIRNPSDTPITYGVLMRCNNAIIRGNNITHYGAENSGQAMRIHSGNNIIVENNTIFQSVDNRSYWRHTIWVRVGNNVTVRNNIIVQDNYGYALLVSEGTYGNISVHNNNIQGTFAGIGVVGAKLENSTTTIYDNNITMETVLDISTHYGIVATNSLGNLSIYRNNITSRIANVDTKIGIYLGGTINSSIQNNTAHILNAQTVGHGVYTFNGTNTTSTGNNITIDAHNFYYLTTGSSMLFANDTINTERFSSTQMSDVSFGLNLSPAVAPTNYSHLSTTYEVTNLSPENTQINFTLTYTPLITGVYFNEAKLYSHTTSWQEIGTINTTTNTFTSDLLTSSSTLSVLAPVVPTSSPAPSGGGGGGDLYRPETWGLETKETPQETTETSNPDTTSGSNRGAPTEELDHTTNEQNKQTQTDNTQTNQQTTKTTNEETQNRKININHIKIIAPILGILLLTLLTFSIWKVNKQ